MSWHASVIGTGPHGIPDGWSGVCGAFCRPSIAPVAGSVKSRGWLTTAAVCGAASGTLITSIDQRPGFEPFAGCSTQLAGRFVLGSRVLLLTALGLAVLDGILLWIGVRVFDRERILMKWK